MVKRISQKFVLVVRLKVVLTGECGHNEIENCVSQAVEIGINFLILLVLMG